jgi:sugar transferase EpsL
MLAKRVFDIAASSLLLLLLSPVLLVTAALVAIKMGRPVIFRQKRPGKGGFIFEMCKFRTMTNARDADGQLLPDAQRLIPFGKLLRATSIDELPELFNVLKGDMSLVGPRPLLVEYLPLYSHRQARRHEMRPGITGWAQVNGRNTISWQEKFELDVWYIDNRSLWLDIKILFMTVRKVFQCEGISHAGEATMRPFAGNADDRECAQ